MAEIEITHARPKMPNMEPFPLMPPGIPADFNRFGAGACDPGFRGIKQASEPWRFGKAYIRGVAVAGAAGGVTIAANPNGVDLFNYGDSDTLTPYGFATAIAGISDTDLNTQGAPVKENEKYYAVGMGIELGRPFTTDNTQLKTYDAWVDAYRQRFFECITENFGVQFQFGDEACEYLLGTLNMWPGLSGNQGGGTFRSGGGLGVSQMVPFKRPVEMGARDMSDQITISLINNWNLSIPADPFIFVPVGITSVVFPVTVSLYGFPICAPPRAMNANASAAALIEAAESDPVLAARLRKLLG